MKNSRRYALLCPSGRLNARATSRLRQVDFARFGGQLLELLTHERRHQAVLDELLDELDALRDESPD